MDLAEEMGARSVLWRLLTALAGVEMEAENPTEAERLWERANETVDFIADHISEPEVKQALRSLPEIQTLPGRFD